MRIIEDNKNITLRKITYYIYYINRILLNVNRKPREISIQSFDSVSGTNECTDKYDITGKFPELYIRRYGSTKIICALLDSGAESNILSLETLEEMFSVPREEVSPLKHKLSLRGSTGLKENAILGEVNVKLSLLQENTKFRGELGIHKWSHCTVKFLVADPVVHLKKIILGTPFMERHKVSLHFSPRPRVSAIMTEDSGSGSKQRIRLKIKKY